MAAIKKPHTTFVNKVLFFIITSPFGYLRQVDFIVKEQKPKCEMAEEILAVPPCKQNFGNGTFFPLTAGLYLYVGRQQSVCRQGIDVNWISKRFLSFSGTKQQLS